MGEKQGAYCNELETNGKWKILMYHSAERDTSIEKSYFKNGWHADLALDKILFSSKVLYCYKFLLPFPHRLVFQRVRISAFL